MTVQIESQHVEDNLN